MKFTNWFNLGGQQSRIVLASLLLIASAGAEIIPQGRRAAWQGHVGVPGGIPIRTTVFTNMSWSATASDINNALGLCPNGQVVKLAPVTYNLNAPLLISKSGVTLRGGGPAATSTVLHFISGTSAFALIYVYGNNQSYQFQPFRGSVVDWTAGFSQGTSNITVSSTSGLTVGQVICLDQLNDTTFVNATNFETYPSLINSDRTGIGARLLQHWTKVDAINGNTVTLNCPLQMASWQASLSPQMFWDNAGPTSSYSGVEDLMIDNTDVGTGSLYNVAFQDTFGCWLKNVDSKHSNTAHLRVLYSANSEVRHSYFHETVNYASQSYGTLIGNSGACLIEDNIFNQVTTGLIIKDSGANTVFAYNYCTNMQWYQASFMQACMSTHGAHACMNLFEGNYGNLAGLDNIHGSGSHNTLARNALIGWEPNKTSQTIPIDVHSWNRYINVVGNILGKAGYHNTYQVADTVYGGNATMIYLLDYNLGNWLSTNLSDPITRQTMLRHMNYDVVTSINNGVVLDPAITDTNLPASYYLAAKPSWFGDLPWPPYNPYSPATAVPTSIPAGYRFVNGTDPSGAPKPAPPANLRVVSVQ